jgi:hypothetical protein
VVAEVLRDQLGFVVGGTRTLPFGRFGDRIDVAQADALIATLRTP